MESGNCGMGLYCFVFGCGFRTNSQRSSDPVVYSGPQKGETLQEFKVLGVLDDLAGKELDFVQQAADKPLVLVFVHDVNRQSLSMVRILTSIPPVVRKMACKQELYGWMTTERTQSRPSSG